MNRILGFANTQARVRARMGELPGRDFWRELAEISRLDGLLDRLRVSSLAHWVTALPRRPEPDALERHLSERWRARRRESARLLPDSWDRLRRGLELGINRPWGAPAALTTPETMPAVEETLPLRRVGRGDWRSLRRELRQSFADIAARYERLWLAHERTIAARRAARSDAVADPDEQWLLRAGLERALRDLAAGDPFHPVLVMILLDLEWIQLERVRALALARVYGWPAPRFFPN